MAQGRHIYQGNGLLLRGGIGIVFGLMAVVTPELLLSPGTPAIGLVLILLSMLTAVIALSTEPSDRGRRGTLMDEYQGIIGVASILNVAFGMILIVMDVRAPAPLLLALGLFVFIFGIFSMLSGILVRLGSGVTFD
jgi:uncharacterized membrane protein HdeD (DUF308 family)